MTQSIITTTTTTATTHGQHQGRQLLPRVDINVDLDGSSVSNNTNSRVSVPYCKDIRSTLIQFDSIRFTMRMLSRSMVSRCASQQRHAQGRSIAAAAAAITTAPTNSAAAAASSSRLAVPLSQYPQQHQRRAFSGDDDSGPKKRQPKKKKKPKSSVVAEEGRDRASDIILAALNAPIRTPPKPDAEEAARRFAIGRAYNIGMFKEHNDIMHDLACKRTMKQHAMKMLPRGTAVKEAALVIDDAAPPLWQDLPADTPPTKEFDPASFERLET